MAPAAAMEFFCELFSEEIPARLQAGAAADFLRLTSAALAPLAPAEPQSFAGPRRIAIALHVSGTVPAASETERGPRVAAPEAALAGFLRKHQASREALRQEGDFWVLEKHAPAMPAAALIAEVLPDLLWRFPWAKSMRWGNSNFTWVRPLRRICCLLGGEIVRFRLARGADAAHGLESADASEGHRFLAPGAFSVRDASQWRAELRRRFVLADAAEREAAVLAGARARAAEAGAELVEDAALLREVAGLVEWPVCVLGRIDAQFMDLPPEVMQVSMRVNQRYFALRLPGGGASPHFVFAANMEAADGGAAIVAGNERVLRARFSDARHFWDLDRRTRLADRVEGLKLVAFNAELGAEGSQYRRTERLVRLAGRLARALGCDAALAERAAYLAKADLTTGMVGEFPELQGVMGAYYAQHDGEPDAVAAAIRAQYQPRGPADPVPSAPVSVCLALADKLDTLAAFFSIGAKPTGSGDPFALRRAALGVIRIIRENALVLELRDVLAQAAGPFEGAAKAGPSLAGEILAFILERLRVQLRDEGLRHDVLQAVYAAEADDNLTRLLARSDAVSQLLGTPDGADLLAGYRRAANILRIEEKRDGPHTGQVESGLLTQPEERQLHEAVASAALGELLSAQAYDEAMRRLAALRPKLDAFFDRVTVNAETAELRQNRLRLLANVRDAVNRVADLSLVTS